MNQLPSNSICPVPEKAARLVQSSKAFSKPGTFFVHALTLLQRINGLVNDGCWRRDTSTWVERHAGALADFEDAAPKPFARASTLGGIRLNTL